MKRVILRLVEAMFVGAVSAWLVGWACAWWIPPTGDQSRTVVVAGRDGVHYWWMHIGPSRFRTNIESYYSDEARFSDRDVPKGDPREIAPAWFNPMPQGAQSQRGAWHARTIASGWPRRSQVAVFANPMAPGGTAWSALDWRSGLTLDGRAPRPERHLPVMPSWGGLLFNAVFYGAMIFFLLTLMHTFHRWLRMTHGRCPSCGYDLRGHAGVQGKHTFASGCPECGWCRAQ